MDDVGLVQPRRLHGMGKVRCDFESKSADTKRIFLAGKTTFIKNMFASYAQDADLKVNDVSPPTSKDEFVHSPEKLCTEIIVSDQTTQTRYHYKVQDTPGYDSMEVRTCRPCL